MARPHVDSSDEDDDLPSLAHLLQRRRPAPTPATRVNTPKLVPKIKNEPGPPRQRILNRSTFAPKPLVDANADKSSSVSLRKPTDSIRERDTPVKRTPQRAAAARVNYRSPDPSDAEDSSDGASPGPSDDSEDLEQSIWCGDEDDAYAGEHGSDPESDSESDFDMPIVKSTRQKPIQASSKDMFESNPPLDSPRRRLFAKKDLRHPASNLGLDDVFKKPLVPISLTQPSPIDRPTSSSSADNDAILKYSPPRKKSPSKVPDASNISRASTPPPSKSPTKLKSPTKKIRIPTGPHRENVDAFWAVDVVNDWNDQHSPRKRPAIGSSKPLVQDSNTPSMKTSSVKSPVRKDKAAILKRKSFEDRKHKLAGEFIQELDQTITGGRIADMTAGGGGIKLVWSKTLNTTAGRAIWTKEGSNNRATIELAEKVIDDEERMVNTLAHEFCHLLNYMISGIRDNPHGKEFKAWAAQVSRAFAHRNVKVTTKHSYVIDFKYVWTCTRCGHEYKRHSKSIDPARSRCGGCKGQLVQTKPVPRQGQASEYQLFMKANFNRIKSENAGKSHAVIMELVGKEYREMKAKKGPLDVGNEVEDLAEALGFVELDA